jgi:hypothetical protein
MALTTLLTSNFQIQYDPAEYSGPGEISGVQKRAEAFVTGCEPDCAVLCEWFGVAAGALFGHSNRVIVTLTKSFNNNVLNGAVNTGYSTSNPKMWVNPTLSPTLQVSDDIVLAYFAAEMIEILMSFKGSWRPADSGGEGLSKVAAELLHPQYDRGFVNAWLASDPTIDPTSAVADSEFRKDWVSQNFTGGPKREAGKSVRGDDDSYSYGCAMLFIYYLKSQLGFSMFQIVQRGGPTPGDTYQALTNGQPTKGFWEFKSLLAQHFPIGVKSPTDDLFPLPPVPISTRLAPGAASSGNTSAVVAVGTDGRIFYDWSDLGEGGGQVYGELEGGGRTDAAPAAALVGPQHNYLFVVIKGLDGNLYVNQGELGKPFAGWGRSGNIQTGLAPGAASSGNTSAVVAVGTDGRIFYDWSDLGQGGHGFTELDGGGRTDAAPAAALVGPQHNYLFVVIKGLDGNLYVNQGELGKPFVGWQ